MANQPTLADTQAALRPQLPLPLQLSNHNRFSNFVPGANALIVDTLQAQINAADSEPLIVLTGGHGKTHLLQASCYAYNAAKRRSLYLPLDLDGLQPAMLDDIEQYAFIALDNLEARLQDQLWETALYDLLNRCREQPCTIMVAMQHSPKHTDFALADCQSRLQWGPEFQLQPLSESERSTMLLLHAQHRGLSLAEEVADYLVSRCSRDEQLLMHTLEQLDAAQLAAKRSLTIPFVKQQLGL